MTLDKGGTECGPLKKTLDKGFTECGPLKKTLDKGFTKCGPLKKTLDKGFTECGPLKKTLDKGFAQCGLLKKTLDKGSALCGPPKKTLDKGSALSELLKRRGRRSTEASDKAILLKQEQERAYFSYFLQGERDAVMPSAHLSLPCPPFPSPNPIPSSYFCRQLKKHTSYALHN